MDPPRIRELIGLDRALGDVMAKHFQLAVNARRAPSGILGNYAEDEVAQFLAGRLSASPDSMA